MDTHPSRHSNPFRARLHLFGVTAAMILALCATLTWPATAAPATNAFTGSVSVPDQVTFAPGTRIGVTRSGRTATLLNNGRVLVVGGSENSPAFPRTLVSASAELYDPATDIWSSTGSMSVARYDHAAILLNDGRVLVVGGRGDPMTLPSSGYLVSTELYDPMTGTWSSTGSMTDGRYDHIATLLNNGKVLVTGGISTGSGAELYDPTTRTWSIIGSMSASHYYHTATLLNNGKVLVAGGDSGFGGFPARAELYDPTSSISSSTGSMLAGRYYHTATLLNNGKVLVAGGGNNSSYLASAELYDPASSTWSSTGSMSSVRIGHTATLLNNGKVLVTAGSGSSAELYDPTTGTWSSTGSIGAGGIAMLLPNGKVLFVGVNSTEIATLLPSNTFTATLTLPSGWLNSTVINAQFVGSTSAAVLDAGSLSNDATTWGAWVTAGSGVTASTTWDVGGEGANKPVSLRLRDVNDQIATVATGSVNVDLTKPTSSMTALLPRSTANIALAWSGSDALSGVAGYDLQVRAGTGAWTDVLTNTLVTSTTYNSVAGTTYAFRVRAKDVAGNIEDWPVDADTTTLAGGTSVSGSIYTATTWSASQSPYLVTSPVIVFPNTTLTIEPGVEVYFSANTGLTVRGNLLSIGTATKPITLTANVATPVKGNWQGVAIATQQGGKATLAFSTIQYASSALSVECCWGGGPVTITDSTFRENNTALSGYAGWDIQVKRSLFENNISAVTSADKVIRDSVFRNNQYGLNATERVSVYNSVFTGNQVALYGGRGTVTYCTMTNNGTGVQAFFEGFTLTYNTIANNTVGVILGQAPVQNNNIYGNATYNVKNTGPANKDVLNNWWGTVDTGLIETGLFDGKDDPTLGLLISQPIRTQAVDITPPLPTVGFSQATSSIGEAGSTAVITVTVSDEHRFPIRVAYVTSNGTATADSDYTPISGTLTFPPDQLSQTISIPILNDTLDESNETVNLTLSTPISATLSTTSILALSIVDDDAPPTVQFSTTALTVDEGVGTAIITATLSGPSGLTVTVPYATLTPGTFTPPSSTGIATAGSDYTVITGTLTFAPNQTSQIIRLPIVNDTLDEVDETVDVSLGSVTGPPCMAIDPVCTSTMNATLGTPARTTITIHDNDAPPTVQFSIATLTVDEGASMGARMAVITATLSTTSSLPITVAYATSDGTAFAGSDYTAISGTLTFTPNTFTPSQTSQTIMLPSITNDMIHEGDETFALVLSKPTNATLGASVRATITIRDNDPLPTVQFNTFTTMPIDEGAGTAVFTVTLSSVSGLPVTVGYATSGGTASAGSDYTPISGTLTFAANQTSQTSPGSPTTCPACPGTPPSMTIRLPIINDTLNEADETVTLVLSNPTNATLGTTMGASSTSTVTIRDNDAPPTVQFSTTALTVDEGVGTAIITATLSGPSGLTVTVPYATSNGTATAGSDYTVISGTLTFVPNQTSQTIRLPIVDDTLDEVDETVALALSTPTNATLGASSTSTVTIRDNDVPPTVQFSTATLAVNESAGTAVFTATLSTASSLPVTVAYATSDGTANAPADDIPSSGTLTFAPNQTSHTVTVAIVNDTLIEADETVALTLSTPTNASLGTSARTILTINDNDGPPTVRFSAATLTVDEGVGTAVITATLSPASTLPVTVAYATSDGTATAGSDYTPISGTLTFAPNQTSQTITLPITNDTLDEVDETVILTLSTPTNAVVGTAPRTTLTILDNDGPTVDVHPTSTRVREGVSTAVLTVTLSAPSVQPVTVAYASHDGTATAGRDYTAISGTLTFAPGEQNKELSLPITDDAVLLEADETVQVSLVTPTGATLGATTASVTIVDNDVNTPPVDIPEPTDPSQPVTVPVNTPAGTVRLTFDNLGSSGVITTQVSVAPLTNAPSSFTLLGFNYEISTSEISFGKATLRLPYRDSDVAAAGIPEESLRLLHFDHGQWKDITTELDTAANIITGVTESFSPFVLGVQDTQQCTISINSGATYSGKLAVQVFSNTPNAAQILVSNDGGFTGAQWQPYRSAMPWTITDPGNRIVTLVTYVRLRDATGTLLCSGVSMSDDVIYDPLAPTVSVTIIQSAQQAQLATQAGGTINVQLTASDQSGGSGVADMQLSTHADFSGAVWQPFSATASIAAQSGDTVYVRVRDGVGNTSGVAPTTLAGNYSVFLPVIVR